MKKISVITCLLLAAIIFVLTGCTKKKDSTGTCRVCKVQGLGVDAQVILKQVCSDDEEQAFRNANAGKTVTCN